MGSSFTRIASKAWIQFLVLAIAIFFIPSIFGHPFAAGDNLIQFNPLRVLAGRIERHGNLPLWNQFIWSGSPLLAGFNAGVFFPTSWLYAFLPATWAWGLSQTLPYFLASFGFYLLMREIKISEFTSRITALAFAYAGVMIGQGVHLDMILGISLAPWMLLCTSRIIDSNSHSKLRYALYLAICYSLVVLAGAPEAMLDEVIMLIVFSLAKLARSRKDWARKLLWLAGAGALSLGLSAAQWLPGLAFQKISQRATPTVAFVAFGAFAPQYFYSFFAPYLFGGPSALSASGYFGPFNWEEVTIYPTIGPIIALFATIGRALKRKLESELLPYLLVAIVGTVLALGSYTPVESWLYHLPLYGQQRLQGRNILALDVAIFAFFGVWLDRLLKGENKRKVWPRSIAFLPAAVIAALYLTFLRSSTFITGLLHAQPRAIQVTTSEESLLFSVSLAIAILSGLVYFFAGSAAPRVGKRLIVVAILLDLAVFNAFGGLGTSSHLSQFNSSSRQMAYLHSLIDNSSRFAVYDPFLYTYGQLNAFGEPDLNIAADNHSIQGYSSLSLGAYEDATQTHAQATLSPKLLLNPLIDTLGTKVLLTSWYYLMSRYGSPKAVPLPHFYIPGADTNGYPSSATVYPDYLDAPIRSNATDTYGLFGRTMEVSSVDVSVGHTFSAATIREVGVLRADGSIVWLSPTSPEAGQEVPGALHYGIHGETTTKEINALGVVVRQFLPVAISDPQQALVTGVGINSTQGYFALKGQLASYLTYPHFRQVETIGNVSIFQNSKAKSILQHSSKVKIITQKTDLNGTLHLSVNATSNSNISWAEAYAPGWMARYTSVRGDRVLNLPTTQNGALQKISVPQGDWRITVFYHPSSAYEGIWISIVSVILTLALIAVEFLKRTAPVEPQDAPETH